MLFAVKSPVISTELKHCRGGVMIAAVELKSIRLLFDESVIAILVDPIMDNVSNDKLLTSSNSNAAHFNRCLSWLKIASVSESLYYIL